MHLNFSKNSTDDQPQPHIYKKLYCTVIYVIYVFFFANVVPKVSILVSRIAKHCKITQKYFAFLRKTYTILKKIAAKQC